MAILEAILTTEYQNQMCINRWHYVSSGDPGPVTPSFALMSAMGFTPPTATPWEFTSSTMANELQNLLSTALVFKAFYVRNLYDPTDFIETPFNAATVGKAGAVPASPALAYGIQSNRVRTDIGRGSKRFAGVCEEFMGDAGIIVGSGVTRLNAICTDLNTPLSYTAGGASLTLTSAVLGLQAYTTPSGRTAYRPYATESAQLEHVALSPTYAPQAYVRTQTSRQYNRGS